MGNESWVPGRHLPLKTNTLIPGTLILIPLMNQCHLMQRCDTVVCGTPSLPWWLRGPREHKQHRGSNSTSWWGWGVGMIFYGLDPPVKVNGVVTFKKPPWCCHPLGWSTRTRVSSTLCVRQPLPSSLSCSSRGRKKPMNLLPATQLTESGLDSGLVLFQSLHSYHSVIFL